MKLSRETEAREMAVFQKNEITEHFIYKKLASRVSGVKNRRILGQIADDEMRHYNIWKNYTRQDIGPNRLKIWFYSLISTLFGFTFGIKLMENGESKAHDNYSRLHGSLTEINGILREEEEHEQALLALLDEERLQYTGSVVLGLNDALVELTGALAGLTFALQNTRVVALTAAITGFAAAMSMSASAYLSAKSEPGAKNPLKAAMYTGLSYIFAVIVLVLPYFLVADIYLSFGLACAGAVLIILLFNFYISVVRDVSFRSRFIEMALLTFTVTGLSFLAGLGIRYFLGVIV